MIEQKTSTKSGLKKIVLIITLCFIFYVMGNKDGLIYILIWSAPHKTPALSNEKGQEYFVRRNCSYKNCFLTSNQTYFEDVREFDVILFNVMTLNDWNATTPHMRSEKQKYVFMSDEPTGLYHVPLHYNGFFNYTWTYKLNSDATWRFIVIKNKRGEVIGPKKDTNFMKFNDMKPTSDEIKSKLQNKKHAVAWFASHCETPSLREKYILKLSDELKKLELKLDTYGYCGTPTCPIGSEDCHDMIETDYYFYLVFENSLCDDYVTEKLLIPTQHYAVPIVYSGANYTRYIYYLSIKPVQKNNSSFTVKYGTYEIFLCYQMT